MKGGKGKEKKLFFPNAGTDGVGKCRCLFYTQYKNDAMGGKEGGIGWGTSHKRADVSLRMRLCKRVFFFLSEGKVERAGEFH